MSILEWIFGKNHNDMMEKARIKCLSGTQTAVDAFHGRMLDICGYKKDECGDCWNEIQSGDEFIYKGCPNYERRCIAREEMHEACRKAMKEFEKDMDEAFIVSFNFILRPFARCYVACGGLKRTREYLERIAETTSKCIFIAFLTGAFLAGPTMAIKADARKGYSRSIVRTFSRKTVVRPPSVGTTIIGTAAGAAVGTVVGEMAYDAMKSEEERNNVPVNERPQMQERPFNAGRGDCGCQGN